MDFRMIWWLFYESREIFFLLLTNILLIPISIWSLYGLLSSRRIKTVARKKVYTIEDLKEEISSKLKELGIKKQELRKIAPEFDNLLKNVDLLFERKVIKGETLVQEAAVVSNLHRYFLRLLRRYRAKIRKLIKDRGKVIS